MLQTKVTCVMKCKVQKGIYYQDAGSFKGRKSYLQKHDLLKNKSFAIIFLRASRDSTASQVGESLKKLWKMYELLGVGKVSDLPGCRVPSGSLSTLIGYGTNIFKLKEVKKKVPLDFEGRQFLPSVKGGEPILEGCGIRYSEEIHENVGITEDIVIQFIADSQLATYRAIVETWKHLRSNIKEKEPLCFTKFYTGFRRDDGRSWLGFHDEISNMDDAKEREGAIFIDAVNNRLQPRDYWTVGGTYLSFLRINIDLGIWHRIERIQQELIIGRDKMKGYPVIGVDINGNPKTWTRSKIRQVDRLDIRKFLDHPDYFESPAKLCNTIAKLDIATSFKILNQSHIGRMRHIHKISSSDPSSRRIFRQGFEFLEPAQNSLTCPFRVGLNFLSFQNDPGRLFFILTDPHWMGNVNFGGNPNDPDLGILLSVCAAGMFFVPRIQKPFPGAEIFI
jgi:deferrochelatase/peroxidase EfeB